MSRLLFQSVCCDKNTLIKYYPVLFQHETFTLIISFNHKVKVVFLPYENDGFYNSENGMHHCRKEDDNEEEVLALEVEHT